MQCIEYKGGYKYQLKKDYSETISIVPKTDIGNDYIKLTTDGLLTIKRSYAWDGPSCPAIPTQNFFRGSLVHDALYQLMREKRLDLEIHRNQADRLLQKHCKKDGMFWFRAWYIYHAVRLCGRKHADPDRKRPTLHAPNGCP